MDIRLRAVRESDLPLFFELQRDPASTALAAVTARDEEAFYAHWRGWVLTDPKGRMRTIVVDDGAGAVIAGYLMCWQIGDARELGYWIARPLWGRGIASAAVRAFLDDETARPLHATAALHNVGSRRILEKSGFTRVGTTVGDDGVELVRFELRGGDGRMQSTAIDSIATLAGLTMLVCDGTGPKMTCAQDALDLIGATYGTGATWVLLPVERLAASFFALGSGLAGEVVQKMVSYQLRLAIVGNIEKHVIESHALRDFVIESNRGRHVWFVPSVVALRERLGSTAQRW